MSELSSISIDKYLEALDKLRESLEMNEEYKYSFNVAGEQVKIASTAIKENKNNPDILEECIILLDMLGEFFTPNGKHDIKTQN